MFNIAMVAGHHKGTPGKRIPKALDPNETREWVLNDRVCDKVAQKLTGYTGYQLRRFDDPTGKTEIDLPDRVRAANAWGANVWVEPHHNALDGKPWSGGGIEVYVHPNASEASREMQKQLYDALIAKTGMRGNRADPLREANFYTLRETAMPAVLLELGYMDSTVDAPIILTEEYADKCAAAIVEVLVKRGGLKKKAPAASSSGSSSKPKDEANIAMDWLHKGDEGNHVEVLQALLDGYGYTGMNKKPLSKDGVFGENTDYAVRNFQSKNGLDPDGIVGDDTWNKLLKQ